MPPPQLSRVRGRLFIPIGPFHPKSVRMTSSLVLLFDMITDTTFSSPDRLEVIGEVSNEGKNYVFQQCAS